MVVGRLVRTRTQKNPTMNDDGSNHDARRGVDDDKPLSSWASRTTPKHWVLVHPIPEVAVYVELARLMRFLRLTPR